MSNPSADSAFAMDDIYRATTTSIPNVSRNVLGSLKTFVGAGGNDPDEKEAFLDLKPLTRRGPPAEVGDDIELKAVQLQFPSARTLDKNNSLYQEERIETGRGTLLVAIQGDRTQPAMITYHDLGLNHVANFQAFFNFSEMRILAQNFCLYHINAPGQEEGAATVPEGYVYPTMEELSEQISDVMLYFNLKSFVGLGVGVGANILVRFALSHPEKVDALCLLNCVSTTAGWIEWGYQKLNARHLRAKGMTQGALDYLMWHHFGRLTEERNHDLVHVYREYFEHHVNPMNLALFIDSYIQRTDLNILRELDPNRRASVRTVEVPVLNMTGALGPHVDDTVTFNSRLDPSTSTWIKLQDCGMVLEEQPAKIVEALRLFLQGNGYALKLSRKPSASPSEVPSPSSSANKLLFGDGIQLDINNCSSDVVADIRITENPILNVNVTNATNA
ncbi:protein NDRG3-like isoform X1 [Daphnia carinata]|uniref:protein NDRG3-like isoform X1 n=1 Tax=Daphnia carinata TaxID=120202 RepID=UPI002580F22E|nr:protein NDRG3-like isoform X1 [Daphnia carinata]XP_057366755.1 protein NDRG3-like isoform X1 [Daphnia carinata]